MSIYKSKAFFLVEIFFLLLFTNSYAQRYGNKFVIAPDYYSNYFTIDRIAQQIYTGYYGGRVYKIDLKTMTVDTTNLIIAPVFANRRHLMVTTFHLSDSNYDKDAFLEITDVDKVSSYTIPTPDTAGNSVWGVPFAFSPNDSNFMFSRYHTNSKYSNYYFSLKDSSIHSIDTSVNFYGLLPPQWSSDTSFVYGASDSCLVEYFIPSKRIDTLVMLHDYHWIVSIAYNTKEDFLAYSVAQYHGYPPLIYFHFKEPAKDSLVFSPFRDDTTSVCWTTPISITDLCWSPDYKRLGFLTSLNTNSNAGIYFYSIDSNRTYRATICEDRDIKNELTWANGDTLVYWDSDDDHIYGMDITPVIDAIRIKKNEPLPVNFSISSYPNPFNPSTTIAVTLPERSNGILSIYDIQGRLVKEYKIKNEGMTNYKITWNAVNNRNQTVASGFYLAVLKVYNPQSQIKDPAFSGNIKVTKLIYLK